MKSIILAALAAAAMSSVAWAQEPPAAPVAQAAAAETPMVLAGTKVRVATTVTLNTISAKTGDAVEFTLVEPIRLGDREVVPAGTRGVGVITAANAKASGGRPGQMFVTVNYLDAGGVKIPLKGLKLSARGVDLSKSSRFTAGILKGSEAEIVGGTQGDAWMTENLLLGAAGLSSAPPAPGQVVNIPRPPQSPTVVEAPPPGMGRVVFFREIVYVGGGWPLDIHMGPDFKANNLVTLHGGNYLVLDLPPGDHVFSTLKNGGDPMTVSVEAGEIVYVKGVSMGLGAVPPTMIGPSDADVFNTMGRMKRVAPRKQKK